jgi:hypothetical protein
MEAQDFGRRELLNSIFWAVPGAMAFLDLNPREYTGDERFEIRTRPRYCTPTGPSPIA